MTKRRTIRVLPVVVVAVFSLAVLKLAGIFIDGGYVFDYQPESKAKSFSQKSWAQENFNFPSGASSDAAGDDVTGSVSAKPTEDAHGKAAEAKPAVQAPDAALLPPSGQVIIPDNSKPVSATERAILERLQARRQELDARAREIDIRENLLKSAEKRIEGKVRELKEAEARIAIKTQKKNEAEAARFKGLVTTYEAMKPKDAAKVFDRLEMPLLYEIPSKIAPRKMSDILGRMTPEAAERLTVEMARRSGAEPATAAADLPKIEGRPTVKE